MTLTSNRIERVEPGAVLYAGSRRLVVAGSRRHQDRWLVAFEEIDDRHAAEALRNSVLEAEPLGPASEGEVWVHELIGAVVVDQAGRELGRIDAVQANPAHDLLVLESGTLVPMVFVTDFAEGRVVVDVPEGLLDLGR